MPISTVWKWCCLRRQSQRLSSEFGSRLEFFFRLSLSLNSSIMMRIFDFPVQLQCGLHRQKLWSRYWWMREFTVSEQWQMFATIESNIIYTARSIYAAFDIFGAIFIWECQRVRIFFNARASNNPLYVWFWPIFFNRYECICIPGIIGLNCEQNVNECESNPCIHGACHDEVTIADDIFINEILKKTKQKYILSEYTQILHIARHYCRPLCVAFIGDD